MDRRLMRPISLAPLVALPATFAVVMISEAPFSGWQSFQETLLAGLWVGAVAVVVAYPVMLIVGIPIILVLWKLGLFRPGVIAVAGALVGGLPFVSSGELTFLLAAGVLSGLLAGTIVWYGTFRDRRRVRA